MYRRLTNAALTSTKAIYFEFRLFSFLSFFVFFRVKSFLLFLCFQLLRLHFIHTLAHAQNDRITKRSVFSALFGNFFSDNYYLALFLAANFPRFQVFGKLAKSKRYSVFVRRLIHLIKC